MNTRTFAPLFFVAGLIGVSLYACSDDDCSLVGSTVVCDESGPLGGGGGGGGFGDTGGGGTDSPPRSDETCTGERSSPPCSCGFRSLDDDRCTDTVFPNPGEGSRANGRIEHQCVLDSNYQDYCTYAAPDFRVPTDNDCSDWCDTCCVHLQTGSSGVDYFTCLRDETECAAARGGGGGGPSPLDCDGFSSTFDGQLGTPCDPQGGGVLGCAEDSQGYAVTAECDRNLCVWVGERCTDDPSRRDCYTCIDPRRSGCRQSIASGCGQ